MSGFAEALRRRGQAFLAQDDAGRVLSYDEAWRAAQTWRDQLGGEKRLVLLYSDNAIPSLRAYLGLLAGGAAIMLTGSEMTASARADLEQRFRPDFVVEPAEGEVVVREGPGGGGALHPGLSLMLSTSGSTGSPKFARFTEAAVFANANSIADYLGLTSAERAMAHLPMHYSFGMSIVNSHVVAGAALILSKRSFVEPSFWDRMNTESATSLSGVPFHFETLLKLRFERRDLPSLRMLTQAGGRLKPELVRRLAEIAKTKGWRLFVMYGQTEAGPRLSYLPPEQAHARAGSVGVAIPGVQLSLIDEAGTIIDSAEVEGELVATGPSIMMGYATCREDLVQGDECHGRLATGDLACRDADGFLWITGRRSRFIKLQGNRVSLDAVEARLNAVGHEAICVGEEDALYVVVGRKEDLAPVQAILRNEFTFSPRFVHVVAVNVPRHANQKINYPALLVAARAGMGQA